MRLLAAVFLLAATAAAHAQRDGLAACLDGIAADSRFAPIAARMAGATPAKAPHPDKKELQLIAEWAAARGDCIQAANRSGNALYRPPLDVIRIETEVRVLASAEALYNRKITWSEFSRERQAIAEEQRAQIAALLQRIQSQRSALEQADRQNREKAEMQRDLDEAERQAALAQQQVQSLEDAANRAASARAARNYGYGARPIQPALLRPYRSCFQFGGRIVCTYR